jgi:hypothetical protein
VFATRRAIEEARRVIPGRVVEVAVAEAIATGAVAWRRPKRRAIVTGPGFRATVRRSRGKVDPARKAWQVLSVESGGLPPGREP